MKNEQLVSICIPTYNGAEFIAEALESVKNQTYQNIEIIISDDNSSDNTLNIINEKLVDSEISYRIFNHEPSGIGANWNNCVKKSKGTFIKFLFQDDLLRSDCIEKMVELANLDKKVGFVYCRRTILHKSDNSEHIRWINFCGLLHTEWYKIKVATGILDGRKYLADRYLMKAPLNKIGEPTAVLIRKECFKKAGYFNENLKQTLDIEYWYKLMKYYKVGFIDEELISFRLHDKQASYVNQRNRVNERHLLNEKFYNNAFWQYHPSTKWKLFKNHSWLGNTIKYFRKIIK